MKTTFSPVFDNDFAEIITRFAREVSPALFIRFENRIVGTLELIARPPEIGHSYKDFQQPAVRSFRVTGFESYLIFCQLRKNEVFFIRLLHGAMDLPAMFPEA